MNADEAKELLELQKRMQQLHGVTPKPRPQNEFAEAMIDTLAAKAEQAAETDTEYLAEDGLLHCKICGGKRQTVIQLPFEGAAPRKIRCWCQCPTEFDKAKEREKDVQISRNRSVCFQGVEELRKCTFDSADADTPTQLITAAKKYADTFHVSYKKGAGILFYGPVGTGKTFLAACIANELLKNGYKVRMTSFSVISDELWNAPSKDEYITDLCKYHLLILDDLGAERKTEYMQEMVYKIVNARYVAGVPMIVTTNLTRGELSKATDITTARTYDRLIEKCVPVEVAGKSRRRAAAAENWCEMREMLGLK